jgi:hypothetical protein
MDYSKPKNNRSHGTHARAGVTDHSDRYVLLFGLSGAIVALTILLMDFAN